jgi:hypothetical protein
MTRKKKHGFSVKKHLVGIFMTIGAIITATVVQVMYSAYVPMIEAAAAANQANDSMTDFVLFRAVASSAPETVLWVLTSIIILLFLLPTIVDLLKSSR